MVPLVPRSAMTHQRTSRGAHPPLAVPRISRESSKNTARPPQPTSAGGTFAQTLQHKPKRPILYHWFGAVAFITEADTDSVIGLGLRGDLLKQLASEPDLKRAAESVIEGSRRIADKITCQKILHQLDEAKRKWATESGRIDGDTPFAVHIIDYLPGRSMPVCPEHGTYRFNLVGEKPQCTFHGDGS
jgi:hypothetical protein